MGRYIDADKVMEEINRIGGHNLCEWETLGVRALIDRQPTADVAPKSEVERHEKEILRLMRILNSYALQYGTVTDQQDVIDKAKSEIAREIFEEIEKTVNACVVDESLFKPAYFEFRKFNEQLAELKKKYTGDQEDGTDHARND